MANKKSIPRLGHFGIQSRIDINTMHRRHLRNKGAVPKEIFAKKKHYVLSRPHFRPEQHYSDFFPVWKPLDNVKLNNKVFGTEALFGKEAFEYIAFVGLRGDEPHRVRRVTARNNGPGGF